VDGPSICMYMKLDSHVGSYSIAHDVCVCGINLRKPSRRFITHAAAIIDCHPSSITVSHVCVCVCFYLLTGTAIYKIEAADRPRILLVLKKASTALPTPREKCRL
jgi:hypothetical protein